MPAQRQSHARQKQPRQPGIEANARRLARSQLKQALDTQQPGGLPAVDHKKYSMQLEKALYRVWHHSQPEYVANVRRLVYNLGLSPGLVVNYQPDTLAALDSATLATGTPMAAKLEAHAQRRREYASLLDQDLDELDFETGEDALTCPACKSKRVITISIQKRAADEGYSNYGECQEPGCRKRFTINS